MCSEGKSYYTLSRPAIRPSATAFPLLRSASRNTAHVTPLERRQQEGEARGRGASSAPSVPSAFYGEQDVSLARGVLTSHGSGAADAVGAAEYADGAVYGGVGCAGMPRARGT
jgi:hypothetical protein